jgi:hypothetical protein
MTAASEIEIEASEEGNFTVADPLTRVKATRMNHSMPIDWPTSWKIEVMRTAAPARITDHR